MPFPLAHPAAILPLRRFCPRHLSFPALVAGSLSPDVGYVFGHLHLDWFSHHFWPGSFGFCLPAGLLLTGVFGLVRSPAVAIMPDRYKELLRPLCATPARSWLAFPVSVLMGAWAHIFLDSLSHPDGWLVEQVPALRQHILWPGGTGWPTWKLLYATFSFLGAAWLAAGCLRWLGQAKGAPALRPSTRRSYALLFGAATLGVAMARSGFGLLSLGIISGGLMLGFLAATAWLFSAK
jgi:hypothetical protein